jgi:hypothetical protein
MEPDMNAVTSSFAYLRLILGDHLDRFRDARADGDRGASAVELAVITAVILVVAGVILGAITIFVNNESGKINTGG